MKNSVQQEILLMTNSSLSKRSFCEKNSTEASSGFSNVERLENACWNGMLEEFLPGMILTVEGKTLLLWEIQNAKSFLHIDLCDQPNFINKELSIDPYLFLNHLNYN
jgi:hypothetical protein